MGVMSGHDGAVPNPRGVKLTYDDFVLFPDDGLRHELIDGEHFVTPSPNAKHQQILLKLGARILTWIEQQRTGGQVFIAPFEIGRASCRERVEILVVAVSIKKKK